MLYVLVFMLNTVYALGFTFSPRVLYGKPRNDDLKSIFVHSPIILNLLYAIFTPATYFASYQFLKLATTNDSKLLVSILGALCMIPTSIGILYGMKKYYELFNSPWRIAHIIINFASLLVVLVFINILPVY